LRTLDEYVLSLEGEKLTHFSHVSIAQHFDGHHFFEVSVPASALKNFENRLGKVLKIQWREKVDSKQVENSFSGILVEVGTLKQSQEHYEVILRGRSPTFLLDGGARCRSFSEKSLQQVVKEILSPYPENLLHPKIKPKSNKAIPYVVQYRESDFQFLSRLAAHDGEWFVYDGSALYFGECPDNGATELKLGQNLSSVELTLRIAPTQFRWLAYDYRKNERYESLSSQATVSGSNTYSKVALQVSDKIMKPECLQPVAQDFTEKRQLDDRLLNFKASMINDLVALSGTSDAPDLTIGKVVTVQGAGEQDGKYLIIAVSHSMDSGGHYENRFEAIPTGGTSPPLRRLVADPFCEAQTAVVEDNNDPDGLGRVRVRFLWQQAPEMSPWIRVVSLHSGADKGVFFIPEKNDEVLVGFESNHPERPFVMGAVYHKNAKPSEWQDKENNKKAFRTKSGNQIYFSDEKGKEEIRIFNKDKANEICLTLEGQGKISLKSKDTLELSAKSIIINADSKISIKSNGETKIEAVNTSLDSSGKLEVNGGSLAEIKAGIIRLN